MGGDRGYTPMLGILSCRDLPTHHFFFLLGLRSRSKISTRFARQGKERGNNMQSLKLYIHRRTLYSILKPVYCHPPTGDVRARVI
jgi:hypothetical protein